MRRFRETHLLWAGIVLAVLWRLILAVWIVPAWERARNLQPFPDNYPGLARSLLERQEFGYGPGEGAERTTVRGPGFPLWLALGMLLGGGNGRWLGFWSAVPILIVAPLLAVRARRRYGRLAAGCAFVFLAFHPLPGVLTARSMSDEFYAACGFGAIFLWARTVRSSGVRSAWAGGAAGALLAMTMLTRTCGSLFLLVLFALGLRIRPRRTIPLAVMTIVALGPPLAWSVRTSRLEGRPVFVHSLAAYNFWTGEGSERFGYNWNSRKVWGRILALISSKGRVPRSQVKDFYYPDLEPAEVATMERGLGASAVKYVIGHPVRYGWRVIKGLYKFWVQAQSSRRTLEYCLLLLPVALAMVPLLRPGSFPPLASDPMAAACALVVLTHMVSYAAFFAVARFGVQVYPAAAWLMAAGISGWIHRRAGRSAPGASMEPSTA